MVALGQTVSVVDQSGKVVKTSKHLVNVFKEAKGAYNERKAELKAVRKNEQEAKIAQLKAQKQLETLAIEDDTQSKASSRRSSRSRSGGEKKIKRKPLPGHERPAMERGFSDSFYTNDAATRSKPQRPSPLRNDSHHSNRSFGGDEPRSGELQRRHTTGMAMIERRPTTPTRSASVDEIDMDLAYGELPPPAAPERKFEDEIELRTKMTSLQQLLDECNCLQHTATATIDNLQKNPDAMAAVALTLAEISNLATKLAPGALASLKSSFPAIIALLASPQFAIAAGVGVGVTIIAFGSYKIIKKIQANKEQRGKALEEPLMYGPGPEHALPEPDTASPPPEEELRELNRIERWRRGVSDAEAESLGTSVTGEFITPHAARSMIEDGKLTEADFKPREARSTTSSRKTSSARKSQHARSEKGERKGRKGRDGGGGGGGASEAGSSRASASRASGGRGRAGAEKEKAKRKEPSGLRMLFKTHA